MEVNSNINTFDTFDQLNAFFLNTIINFWAS